MRIVGFLVALLIVVWVVGTLFSLYRARHKDNNDSPIDQDQRQRHEDERQHRQRMLAEEKQRHLRGDDLPPW